MIGTFDSTGREINRYLLDTGIAQDFQDGRLGVREQADADRNLGHWLGVCVPVLGCAPALGILKVKCPI